MTTQTAEQIIAALEAEQIDTVRRDVLNHDAAAMLRSQAQEIEQSDRCIEELKLHYSRALHARDDIRAELTLADALGKSLEEQCARQAEEIERLKAEIKLLRQVVARG